MFLPAAPLRLLTALRRFGGDVPGLRLPGVRGLAAFSPAAVQDVQVTNATDFSKATPQYDRVKHLLGDGLITSEGQTWRLQRRQVQPELRSAQMTPLLVASARAADGLRTRWLAASGVPDVWTDVASATLGVALEVLAGASSTTHRAHVHTVSECLDALTAICLTPLPYAASLPLPATARFRRARARLDHFMDTLIDQRLAGGSARHDVLSALLAGTRERAAIRRQLLTLLLAGYETSASALTWSLALLAHHPDAASAVAAEAGPGLDPTAPPREVMAGLPFTSQVVLEALRLFPPIWALSRRAVRDTRVADRPVAAGTLVFVSPWVTHRDPMAWPDAERFDPQRFSRDALRARREGGVPRMAFCPFGGGARQCVGDQFALAQVTVMLAALARRLRWSAPKRPAGVAVSVTLRPSAPLALGVRPC